MIDSADKFIAVDIDKSLSLYEKAASIANNIKDYEKLMECKQTIALSSIGKHDPKLLYNKLLDFQANLYKFQDKLGDKKSVAAVCA